METLEKIDTQLDKHGIVFVKTAIGQLEKAKEHWIRYDLVQFAGFQVYVGF